MDTPPPLPAPEKRPPSGPGSAPPPLLRATPPAPKQRTPRFFWWLFAIIAGMVLVKVWEQNRSNRGPGRPFGGQFRQGPEVRTSPWQPGRSPVRSRVAGKKKPVESVTGPQAAAPRFVTAGGVFTDQVKVELAAAAPGAKIRYTLDGSEPSAASTEYSNAFALNGTTLVKAKSFEPGVAPSPTVSQTYTFVDSNLKDFTSDLPLVIIDAFGQQISKQEAIPVSLRIIGTGGQRSSMTGPGDFDGRCDIKLHGYSTLRLPKHSYNVKIRDDSGASRKAPILGMPEGTDWVLYAPFSDKTMLRDVLAYDLSNQMGHWAAHTRFVEVFLSRYGSRLSRRDYVGVYVLEEKIRRGKDRVAIAKLTPNDNTEPEVSGGYIIKRDHTTPPGGGEGQFSFFNQKFQSSPSGDEVGFRTRHGLHLFYVEPKEREITAAQKAWLKGYLNQFESALYGPNFKSPTEGYAKYLDVDSFIDQFLIVELSKNIDGFRYSCYMSKDRNGKLRMEPIWDWNLSFGNANYHQGWMTEQWYYPLIRESEVSWVKRLRQDPEFWQRVTDRWAELRRTIFAPEHILQRVDELAAQLQESQVRNYERWRILGQFVNPNWYVGNSYQDEVDWMKNWIQERIAWIDSQFIAAPNLSRSTAAKDNTASGVKINMRAAAGTVFYTTDGSDPRMRGGAPSSKAHEYTEPVSLEPGTKVMARCRDGDAWSGLSVGAVPGKIVAGQ